VDAAGDAAKREGTQAGDADPKGEARRIDEGTPKRRNGKRE